MGFDKCIIILSTIQNISITLRILLCAPYNQLFLLSCICFHSLSENVICTCRLFSWFISLNPMDCSTPGLPVHYQHPEFTKTHVHWVSDATKKMKEEITKEKDKRKKKKVHRKNKDVFTSLALKYKSLKHLWVWEIILCLQTHGGWGHDLTWLWRSDG